MADPCYGYGSLADRGISGFSGQLTSEPPLASNHSNGLQGAASDFLRREAASYGLDNNISRASVHPQLGLTGAIAGVSRTGYPSPLNDPNLMNTPANIHPSGISNVINDRPSSLRYADGPSAPGRDSNVLFVDGLPTDCTRREVGHLFRPFIGYEDIKVIHKMPRRSGDKALVFCFVEFVDAKCARAAMEALQGYKFDDKKPDSPVLRINFAHFPFRPPHDHDEHRAGIPS